MAAENSNPTDSLANLTVGWLTKFIRQYFEQNPVTSYPQLSADELLVENKLIVADRVDFASFKTIKFVGSQGQPVFTASWVNYGAPYSNAGFIKKPDGWVELIGAIKNGTVGSSAFTLPPGYRPASTKSLGTLSNGVFGRVDIGSDGTVTPISPSNNASVVLDGLHFLAK